MKNDFKEKDKLLPHAIEAEQALIGAIFKDWAALITAHDAGVVAAVFYDQKNGMVFKAMERLFKAGTEINEIFVLERLKADEPEADFTLESMMAYIDCIETATSIRYFAKLVVDAWKKRQIIRYGRELVELAHTPGDSFDEVRRAFQGPLTQLGSLSVQEVSTDLRTELVGLIDQKKNEFAGTTEEVPAEHRVSMGMPGIEEKLGYIDRRVTDNMIVVGAPSSRGKSTLLRQILNWNLILHRDWNIVLFVQEGGLVQTFHHMACSMAMVPNRKHHQWLNDEINKGAEAAKKANEKVKKYFGHLDFLHEALNRRLFAFERDRSIADVVSRCREIESRQGRLDLIIVDYIQNTDSTKKNANREQEVSDVSNKLQGLQTAMGCPLVTGCQLNEDGKARESRAIFNDATRMWILDRPKQDMNGNDQHELGRKQYFQTLAQTKFRGGETGLVGYNFNCECGRFLDYGSIPDDKRGRPRKPTVEDAVDF